MTSDSPAIVTPALTQFADPTALGLIGLAVGCAALTPIAFGVALTPAAFKTAAMFCLVFGGGLQFLAGLMSFANRNLHGGTLLTAFSVNWVMNWWALDGLAEGVVPDHSVVLSVDVLFLVVFVVMTWAFGYFSKLLFFLLLDIVVLYVLKVVAAILGTQSLALPIAICTVVMGLIGLWIVFALLVNPVAGKAMFRVPGPMYRSASRPSGSSGHS